LRTASLIQYLARTRHVDLILFRQPGAPDPASHLPAGLIRRASVIQLPPTGRGQTARAMRNSSRVIRRVPPLVDRFAGFQREVENAIGAAKYEIGLIEHSWCAPYWAQIAPACQRTVLDLHKIAARKWRVPRLPSRTVFFAMPRSLWNAPGCRDSHKC
jgi:hypothetical protein